LLTVMMAISPSRVSETNSFMYDSFEMSDKRQFVAVLG
jgi:hypothetical protein